jgi:hypothetical protein
MEMSQALDSAQQRIFMASVGDTGSQLCERNMRYGLAKIHHVEAQLGSDPRSFFVGAPDATITRNRMRWRQGFGYGGILRTPSTMAILDGKPNGCGMLVADIGPNPPSEKQVFDNADALRRGQLELDGVPLEYDLDESNHFVDVCELEQRYATSPKELPRHLVVLHSSGHEHRASSPFGAGLYFDQSDELARRARKFETPWGPLSVLLDEQAKDYVAFCQRVQRFNQDRRELYARRLFGDVEVLNNATHQGFRAAGQFYLGCYWFDSESQLYPLALGPDQPLYLLRPKRNFSREIIESMPWAERAARVGLTESLLDLDVLPHGGGYAIAERFVKEDALNERGEQRRYHLAAGRKTLVLDDIRALPFGYRDHVVLKKTLELNLAEIVARYRIRYVVK